jgi:hypothetical protein
MTILPITGWGDKISGSYNCQGVQRIRQSDLIHLPQKCILGWFMQQQQNIAAVWLCCRIQVPQVFGMV